MKKIISVLFLIVLTISFLVSCSNIPDDILSQTSTISTKYETLPFSYCSVYCTDTQASTEIALNNDKLYCKWFEAVLNKDGFRTDYERLDVIESIKINREWTRISKQSEIDTALTFFKNYDYHPLNEKIGDYIVSTDDNNDFYITDTTTNKTYDLKLNLEDWRRFATNNDDMFAVLSAQGDNNNTEIEFIYLNRKPILI